MNYLIQLLDKYLHKYKNILMKNKNVDFKFVKLLQEKGIIYYLLIFRTTSSVLIDNIQREKEHFCTNSKC